VANPSPTSRSRILALLAPRSPLLPLPSSLLTPPSSLLAPARSQGLAAAALCGLLLAAPADALRSYIMDINLPPTYTTALMVPTGTPTSLDAEETGRA